MPSTSSSRTGDVSVLQGAPPNEAGAVSPVAALLRAARRAALASGVAMALYAAGFLEFAELRLLELRFAFAERVVSEEVLLVEIDRRSLDEIGVWPWPRRIHGLALDRLDAAGAASVSFDVDFSARSVPEEDAALARSLARAEATVYLAAFADPDGGAEVAPLEALLKEAEPASVLMPLQEDGRIWRAIPERSFRGGAMDAMFTRLAARAPEPGDFWIDYSFDPETIPVISFVDIAAGRFDPAEIRGRRVLIGATAVELGDIAPAPRFGSLPGPVIQVLAAESIDDGRRLQRAPAPLVAGFTALVAFLAALLQSRTNLRAVIASLGGGGGLAFSAAALTQAQWPLILDVAPAAVALALSVPVAYAGRVAQLDLRLLAKSLALNRANLFMSRVAENLEDGLVTLDSSGAVKTLNRAASNLFLVDREDAANPRAIAGYCLWPRLRGLEDIRHALARASWNGHRRRAVCARSNGERFYAEVAVTSIDEGSDRVWVVLVRDVTGIVQAERAARRREALLRDLKVRAEAATRTKTEFVATMSHELRTPLNSIIGFSSIMNDEAFGPLGADAYRQMSSEMKNSGARLLRLLTHILDYANAEMDRLEIDPAPVDIVDLTREAVSLQSARAEQAGIAVAFSANGPFHPLDVDRVAIQKAIGNILNNAIRFSEAGGSVRVAVREAADGGAEIAISDEGLGMPPSFLARCCEPFEQLDKSASRGFDGAGLGLTVAKAFIERHGGTLSLQSAPQVGTTATIHLPGGAAPVRQAPTGERPG